MRHCLSPHSLYINTDLFFKLYIASIMAAIYFGIIIYLV